MKHLIKTAVLASTLAFAVPQAAHAQDEYPLTGAEWIEITGIDIHDGAGYKYATHLADAWRKNMDYSVEQGWIESYEIWSNTHARKGEPDLWLITRFDQFATNAEYEERGRKVRAMMQRTITQLNSESGNRAEYRTILGDVLAKRLVWRD
ncbi:hypothetical protein GRI34_12425 [Erythrobacter aquimaris]|uniref:Uncharacterized protein n=1 Tax=Qipengyuania aquimaris TaxID=255984 RepID=A0A6I4TMP0_9SPHN|nr:hypothetical protein [Qipengyuania aquimaris]MXO97224.1 hypothetical protein [Qipengyuania aquimaris]